MTGSAEAGVWIERLARAGFAANGVVYLLIGVLAFMAAAGQGGDTTGTHGALEVLLRQPLGRYLLGLLAAGLFGYALWRIIAAIADPESGGRAAWKRGFVRLGYAGSAIVHAALGWEAARLALGRSGTGGDDAAQDRTAQLMALPWGQWLVALAAAGVAGYGITQIVRGLRGDIDKHLALGRLGPDERRLVVRAARIGMVARGAVFVIMGLFLVTASLERDPSEAGGLGEALRALRDQPYAPYLLGGVGLGLAAYGAFQLARARYRVIATP
ncbi:MAG: DUF1206 domain-containing protein [Gemmatimonadales bacterium]|nr:DUF1206 domain-containing protein [Gemmatimonadales bacterium]